MEPTEANIRSYYPFELSPRQRRFVDLDHEEAFYGGAAGGGKSDALIASALKYIHVPGYKAIIFRRTRPNLQDLIDRTLEWFSGKGAIWNEQRSRWKFPSGAHLCFGHMQHENDKFDYKGPEFQYIAWDELTEFTESQYLYLFSRRRKAMCQYHKGKPRDDCKICNRVKLLSVVPLRTRGASNPDGLGREWVKDRFISDEAAKDIRGGAYRDLYEKQREGKPIAFVPSRARDNPGVDHENYITESLAKLDPVTRARLEAGDWTIQEQGKIKAAWLRYFVHQGDYYRLLDSDHSWRGDPKNVLHPRDMQRFTIIDCAGSSDDVAKEKRGKPHSYSVISTFDFEANTGRMLLIDMRRGRWEFPELVEETKGVYAELNPAWIGVEDEKTGRALLGMLRNLPMRPISHEGKGKAERFSRAANEMSEGKIFISRDATWRGVVESELLSWTGHPDEPFDIGDTIAYGGIHADRDSSKRLVIPRGGLLGNFKR